MAFTTTWSTIITSQTDADSPIDITLMESIRQNLIYAYEWIGQGYTPSIAHNHDGVNSRTVTLAANSVNSSAYVAASITSTKLGTTSIELGHLKMSTAFFSVTTINPGSTTYFGVNANMHGIYTNTSPGNVAPCYIRIHAALDGSTSTGIRYIHGISNDSSGGAFSGTIYWNYHSS